MVGLARLRDPSGGITLLGERIGKRICLAVAVLGGLDQILLCQLEPLSLALAALDERPLGWVEVLVAGTATDPGRLAACRVHLLLLPRIR